MNPIHSTRWMTLALILSASSMVNATVFNHNSVDATTTLASQLTPKHKIIDNGGSGPYKAEAREESSMPDVVVYKPADMNATVKAVGKLPVLIFANGGCNDTSLPHERMLNEIASHGYLVVALGSMQERIDDRKLEKSSNHQMTDIMDWLKVQSKKKGDYKARVDLDKIAVGGQSCGGAMALDVAKDARVKTCIMVNSGMGDIQMAGASRESLKALHSPILYMEGGESDIAYANGVKDYERINHVFAAFANHLTAGHVGDFAEPYGGSFARMIIKWLDWQFRGDQEAGKVFLEGQLEGFPEWTMKSKDLSKNQVFEPFEIIEQHVKNNKGQDIWGQIYKPKAEAGKKVPFIIMAHGYNSSSREVEAYAQTLAMNGIGSYVFDFCGGSVNSRSEGKTTEMSVFTEADDIAAIVKAAQSWNFVDADRLALLGCSQGGLVAAIASSQMPEAFKCVILVYPALMIAEHAVHVHPKEAINSQDGVDVMGMKLSHVYYDQLVGYKVFEEMKKYTRPVMIVYGDKDPIAAGDYMQRAKETYRSCEVNVIPNGAHGFPAYETHVLANQAIVSFLLRKL